MWAAVVAGWIAYCWFQYHTAALRVEECQIEVSGLQGEMCTRHAIEARDFVTMWGFGVPIVIVIVIAIARDLWRNQPLKAK